MKTINTYQVDTKEACFFCLKRNVSGFEGVKPSNSKLWSIIGLCRFLKCDYATIFNLSTSLEMQQTSLDSLEETEMCIPLCNSCIPILSQFEQLYKEWKLIRLKLNASVETIHDLMRNAEGDRERFQEFKRQLMTRNPIQLMNANIAENLRKEIIHKCSVRLENVLPTLELIKIEIVEPTRSQTEAEGKDCAEASSQCSIKIESSKSLNEQVTLISQVNQDEDLDINLDQPFENNEEERINTIVNGENEHGTLSQTMGNGRSKENLDTDDLNDRGRFICTMCPRRYESAQNLNFHMVELHMTTYFSSLRDPTIHPKRFQLAVHALFKPSKLKSTHRNATTPFSCPYCKYGYRHGRTVKLHMVNKHFDKLRSDLQTELQSSSEAQLSPNASSVSLGQGNWKRGRKGQGRFTCQTCGNAFRTKLTLRVHMRVHTGEMPYKCNYCQITFQLDGVLNAHVVRSHIGDIFKNCREEGMSTETFERRVASVMKKYVGTEPTEKKLVCYFCSKKYSTPVYCKYHLITSHHPEIVGELMGLNGGNQGDHELSPFNQSLSTTTVQGTSSKRPGRPPKNKSHDYHYY